MKIRWMDNSKKVAIIVTCYQHTKTITSQFYTQPGLHIITTWNNHFATFATIRYGY